MKSKLILGLVACLSLPGLRADVTLHNGDTTATLSVSGISGLAVTNDAGATVVRGVATTSDPTVAINNLAADPIAYDTTVYNKIVVRMKVDATVGSSGALYWGTDTAGNGGFSGSRLRTFSTVKGSWQTYEIDMTGVAGWTGHLTNLRIDPFGAASDIGKSFSIDYVSLEPVPALNTATLSAEGAVLAGGTTVQTTYAGYLGSGYVTFPTSGGSVTWNNVNAGPGGGVYLTFRYALGATPARGLRLTVNGQASTIDFAPTGAWTTWSNATVFVPLAAGTANTLSLASTGQGGPDLDQVTLSQPAPVQVPALVYWGNLNFNSQLVDAGSNQWTFVQQHQDGMLLHGGFWALTNAQPVGVKLAALLAPKKPHYLFELGMPGVYPNINSAVGTAAAGTTNTGHIKSVNQLMSWGFSQPDISLDYHQQWAEVLRYRPEFNNEDFFLAWCGNWETYTGTTLNAAGPDRQTFGYFRQYVEAMADAFPGIRVANINSPVYFNWDDKLELGEGNNTHYAWLKMERRGGTVDSFWSPTGDTWVKLGTVALTLPTNVFAGVAVTSHDNTRLAAASFQSCQVRNYFDANIGIPGRGGDLSVSGGVFTLTGWGENVNRLGARDHQYLVYRDWSGDGQLVARVNSLTGSNPGRTWAKAGVAFRESTNANAKFCALYVSQGEGIRFQSRTAAGSNVITVASPAGTAPKWLKLARTGTSFTASTSADGTNWTAVGTTSVTMNTSLLAGLVADSQVYWESVTAAFSSVSFLSTAADAGSWVSRSVGSQGVAGSASLGSTITVNASGADIQGTADGCQFVSKSLNGDGSVVTKFSYFADKASPGTNALNEWAKAGLMIRATTNADSINAANLFTPDHGIRGQRRTATAGTTSEYGAYDSPRIEITYKNRPVMNYLTGNDWFQAMYDAFPAGSAYVDNYEGYGTDSPYPYQKWGGSESNPDAIAHRTKIRNYEAWLQARGLVHMFTANDTTGGASGTQAERNAWDRTYYSNSLRSLQLHQIEGGHPDRFLLESWYAGPFTLVPETQAFTFCNLVKTALQYVKGPDQNLDLEVKLLTNGSFVGANLYQGVPADAQSTALRVPTTATVTLRVTNRGTVAALPVLQVYKTGDAAWGVSVSRNGTDVTSSVVAGLGYVIKNTTQGQELIAPNASVDFVVTLNSGASTAPLNLVARAFWNPQDPNLAVKDAVQIVLTK